VTNPKLTIALPDTHFPEQDEAAVACATKVVRELKPWRIVHLGDLLDGQPFSAHERSKMVLTEGYDWLHMEVRPAQRWIDELLKYCDLFVLHEGNHEHRIERWANKNGDAGRALWGQIRPDHAILGGYNPKQVRWIPYVPDSDITGHYEIAPNLISIHGWSYAIAADRIHLQSAGIGGWSVIFGHTHRAQLATTRNPRTSELLQSWSPGWPERPRAGLDQGQRPDPVEPRDQF